MYDSRETLKKKKIVRKNYSSVDTRIQLRNTVALDLLLNDFNIAHHRMNI